MMGFRWQRKRMRYWTRCWLVLILRTDASATVDETSWERGSLQRRIVSTGQPTETSSARPSEQSSSIFVCPGLDLQNVMKHVSAHTPSDTEPVRKARRDGAWHFWQMWAWTTTESRCGSSSRRRCCFPQRAGSGGAHRWSWGTWWPACQSVWLHSAARVWSEL